MEDLPKESVVFGYSYKTWKDHLAGLIGHPFRFLTVTFAIFGTIWTICEASVYFFELQQVSIWLYASFCLERSGRVR